MKTIRFYVWMLFAALTSVTFTACEDDKPAPKPEPDPLLESHFDIWVSIGENAGMGSAGTLLVQNTKSLDAKEQINFVNTGADVTAKLYQEAIIKGAYYYQVPKEKNRFGKYQIVGSKVKTIAEFPFQKNTLKDRRYTHAWVDDHTLVLMAANGKADKVIWIKVNTDQMKIIAEGELNLPKLQGKAGKPGKFSTSGIASFRKSDGKILYSYLDNNDKVRFYMAFINPADMSVEKTVMEDRAEFMAGTAYGELLQSKSFGNQRSTFAYPAANSTANMIDLFITRLLRQETRNCARTAAATADQDYRLRGSGGYGARPFKPLRRIGMTAFVKERQQFAAGDDAAAFPLTLGTNIDQRNALCRQTLQLGGIDIDDFSLCRRHR